MLDIEDVIHWLRDGEEWKAAEALSQCRFSHEEFIDWDMRMEVEMAGYIHAPVYDLKVEAPRRILKLISGELEHVAGTIEEAIRECAESIDLNVREVRWVPKFRADESSPSDPEIEAALAALDSDHVKTAWTKALNRRQIDPDGAITAAKILVESVCKHILSEAGVEYPSNPDITKLYHMVCEELRLSPEQYFDKNMKRVLGNCQAVVAGIAFMRNNLGDAHAREPGATFATPADAELAVNLAGAVATFLVRKCESQKEFTEQANRADAAIPGAINRS